MCFLREKMPPAYSPTLELYKDSDIVAFVSLMNRQVSSVMCYSLTGCAKSALVCSLEPAALTAGVEPIP